MALHYFILFITLSAFSQTKPQVQVLPNPQTLEDFDHQFKGCPENSECDQVMGLQMTRWKDLISKLKDSSDPALKKAQELEEFRGKYGIPVEFYTSKKSQQGFKPLLFNSHCKDHNSRPEETKVLRGIAFLKSLSKDKGLVWRDQAQIEVPTESLLIPQPVIVHYPTGIETYYLPLGDQPLFIKNKELYVVKEENEFFFILKVAANGDWKIVELDLTRLSEWEDKRENIACPVDKNKKAPGIFGAEFCKNVWDEDLKKAVVVKMHQGCPN